MSELEVSKTRQPRQLVLPFTSFERDCNLLFTMDFANDAVYEATEAEIKAYWRFRYGQGSFGLLLVTLGESSPDALTEP